MTYIVYTDGAEQEIRLCANSHCEMQNNSITNKEMFYEDPVKCNYRLKIDVW